MITLLSPAKTLDFESKIDPAIKHTQPQLDADAAILISALRMRSIDDIAQLMMLSRTLAALNVDRYQHWQAEHVMGDNCRQCVIAFKGGVYQGLAVENWSIDDYNQSQSSLRILSGLYGLLRPLDLIYPYRLEMGTKLETTYGKNLYEFWGSKITDELNKELANDEHPAIINLASKEYFSSVKPRELAAPVYTPDFKDFKNGKYKVISFFAKKARGTMAAWIIKNKIHDPEKIKEFNEDGYSYNAELSDGKKWVFTRNQEEA